MKEKPSKEKATHLKGGGETDWERLRRDDAEGIEPVPDADEGEFDWSKAQTTMPRPK